MVHIAAMRTWPPRRRKCKRLSLPAVAEKATKPIYPWGLCLRLTEKELQKLDLSDDVDIGDMVHIFAMAKVTSVSMNASEGGENRCCVELQITHMSLEDEDHENEEEDDEEKEMKRRTKWYGTGVYNDE
jgi:hypothetical protein